MLFRSDKMPEGNVSPMIEIQNIEYDYVVISVIEKMMYKSMYNDLINLGVDKEKILWIEPLYVSEYYKID